ncbi:hypothetical protein DF268_11085 [Streptomyces sp. V2]|uniref:hypothetical protein n=1 Tax=Streptomyces TaxID=1883 RepID=UPI0006EBD88E|nr:MULTISPECIES: hypothetical protein [Streptomyces]PWG13491.1 hypothetical protein DF268_11085 [Streptomyces sp. V2]
MDHKDVDAAVAEMLEVLGSRTAEDWTVAAGPLEWTCWETAAHIGHDLLAYAAQPTGAYLPTAPPGDPTRVLLWCTGRAELAGLPRQTSWTWQAARPD